MNVIVERRELERAEISEHPSRAAAEEAVRTLIRWAGDDRDREGLVGTPDRVVRAYEEFFAGYVENPREILRRTFEEIDGYDEMVVLAPGVGLDHPGELADADDAPVGQIGHVHATDNGHHVVFAVRLDTDVAHCRSRRR